MPRSCRDCLPMMPTELSAVLPARHIQEECGVFGVYAPETTDVAPLAYYALYALQHRGQESAGIAVNDDGVFTAYRDVGLVNEVFPAERLRSLGTGTIAVGHVRYGTTGSDNKRNVQPILVNHYKGRMALAHNGNLTNSHALRQELESQGSIFQTTTDSEVIAYIIVQERLRAPSIEEAVSAAMDRMEKAGRSIVEAVEANPAKAKQVRRFANYYLPDAVNILQQYATLARQGVKGENAAAIRTEVEHNAASIATAFENQLDALYAAESMDLSADLTVLQNMLKGQGL